MSFNMECIILLTNTVATIDSDRYIRGLPPIRTWMHIALEEQYKARERERRETQKACQRGKQLLGVLAFPGLVPEQPGGEGK